jgi:integrase
MKTPKTVSELFDLVFGVHWSKDRFKTSGHQAEVLRIYNRSIKDQIGESSLQDLTPPSVAKWHHKYSAKPFEGNRALSVLSKMYNIAERFGWIPVNTNPCRLVESFKERKRNRYASSDEIKRICDFLEKEMQKKWAFRRAAIFIYAMIYTGARPRSLERARRDQIKRTEVEGKTFGIMVFSGKSTAVTGEDEKIVIPPQALALIDTLPVRKDGLLFGINSPKRLWRRIQKEVNCPDLWIRDLRRTFATIGFSDGVSVGVIGELLNHRSTQTTKIYAKLNDTAKIEAIKDIANVIDAKFR